MTHRISFTAWLAASLASVTASAGVLQVNVSSRDGQPLVDAVVIVGNMSHMCVDGITRAAVDFGYDTTVLHDACATLDLQFNGVTVPAEHVHAAFMAALSFGYAPVISTAEYLAKG